MGKKARLKAERAMEASPLAAQDGGAQPQGSSSMGVKLVVAFVGAGLLVMFLWSFAYRVNHPSLVQAPRERPAQGADDEHDHENDGPMKMITGLMQRLQENPNDVETLSLVGEQFMRMQQWDRASQLLERALAVAPSNVEVLNLLGICDFNRDKYREAADKFEVILELAPDNMMARFNLGILYGHFLKDKAKAMEFLKSVADSEAVDEETRKQAREEMESLK